MSGKIIIYTDGASKGNPGPGGWGAIIASGGKIVELGGHEAHTTNNRMEMRAALEALGHALKLPRAPIIVHTDSSYLIGGITKWVKGWKAHGWMTSQKKEVMNKDLWSKLSDVAQTLGKNIEWKYVGGHVGVAGNERVDEIASNFALGKKVYLHSGSRGGYSIDVHATAHDAMKYKTKTASRVRSKQKAYSYVSRVDDVVKTHKTWAECEARVKGRSAKFKKAISPKEEAQIIKEFSARR